MLELQIFIEKKRFNYKDANTIIRAEENLSNDLILSIDSLERRLNNELIKNVNTYNRVIRSAFDVYELTAMSIYDEQEINKFLKNIITKLIKLNSKHKDLLNKVYKLICNNIKTTYNAIRKEIVSQIHDIQLSKEVK